MERQQQTRASAKPWVEWLAHRIDDPVTRLKFLQSVTPLAPPQEPKQRWFPRVSLAAIILLAGVLSFFLAHGSTQVKTVVAAAPKPPIAAPPAPATSNVWLVDKSADSESFSNGLRIDTRFETANHPRSYLAFPAGHPSDSAVRRTQPVGIVFHTTESHQAPFEASQNTALKQIGESLVEFVRQQRAYHYLIDRFGRVYRIVSESDAANHAGYSVWADTDWVYLNLNESFLGISFEAQTEPGQSQSTASPAQIRSAAMLIEMLRNRYGIPTGNCVTHAQVSVNPDNMRVGFHTDWASAFPFRELGLPDNYALPLPALTAFGFEYDAIFQRWGGTRLAAGVELAEQELARQAAESGISLASLRKTLQKKYHVQLAQTRGETPTSPVAAAPPDSQ